GDLLRETGGRIAPESLGLYAARMQRCGCDFGKGWIWHGPQDRRASSERGAAGTATGPVVLSRKTVYTDPVGGSQLYRDRIPSNIAARRGDRVAGRYRDGCRGSAAGPVCALRQ